MFLAFLLCFLNIAYIVVSILFFVFWWNSLWHISLVGKSLLIIDWFGLVSFVKQCIKLHVLFNAKAILVEKLQIYYLIHRWGNKGVHTLLMGISLKVKVKVIAWLEFSTYLLWGHSSVLLPLHQENSLPLIIENLFPTIIYLYLYMYIYIYIERERESILLIKKKLIVNWRLFPTYIYSYICVCVSVCVCVHWKKLPAVNLYIIYIYIYIYMYL